ncbi:PE family protein, partial [Mycobacterium sp. THU-M104]
MSFVYVVPDEVSSAAAEIATIGSTIGDARTAAAGPTTAVLAAGGDEVSTAIAGLFSDVGTEFQALADQAAAFHHQFVQTLTGGGSAYGAVEAANVSPLQTIENLVNTAPAAALQTAENLVNTPALQPIENVINTPTEVL